MCKIAQAFQEDLELGEEEILTMLHMIMGLNGYKSGKIDKLRGIIQKRSESKYIGAGEEKKEDLLREDIRYYLGEMYEKYSLIENIGEKYESLKKIN